MKRTFEVGHGLTCDVDRLIASRLLIQANSGAGKTRTLRRLLEQTHGKVQHLVIDPEGEYHTLREKFDYVLAAPKGGDTVAHPRTAKLLAERLLQLGVSAILDIYELNPDGRQAFVKAFLQALVDAPRELWHPALIVLDEAHVYAPEGSESDSTSAVKAMASRGRKRGFCLVPATQRLAKLSKDVAAECNNKLIGRCTLDVDIKRAAEELGFTTKEQKHSLRQLQPGQFFAYGPAFGITAPQVVSVGGITTSHPEPGQQAAPVPPPTEKVRKVLQQLADLPAEADAREKSMADLKKELVDTKRALAQAQRATPAAAPAPKAEPKVIEKKVIGPKEAARIESSAAKLDQLAESFKALLQTKDSIFAGMNEILAMAARAAADLRVALAPPAPAAAPVPSRQITPGRAATAAPARPAAPVKPRDGDAPALGKAERAILTVLAQHPDGCEKGKLTLLTGYRYSGGFRNSLGALRTAGYIVGGNEQVMTITADGVAAAGDYEPLPTGDALRAFWSQHASFGKAERAILTALLARPAGMDAPTLCEVTGYEYSGGFRNALGALRTAGVLVGSNTGVMKATPDLLDG